MQLSFSFTSDVCRFIAVAICSTLPGSLLFDFAGLCIGALLVLLAYVVVEMWISLESSFGSLFASRSML